MKTYNKYQPKINKLEISNSFVSFKEYYLLDFLFNNIKGQSKNNIKTILKSRCVLVNDNVVTQFDYLLKKNDIVQISKSPVKGNKEVKDKTVLDIIYEDDEFIVIENGCPRKRPYPILAL